MMIDANENSTEQRWRGNLRIAAFTFGLLCIATGPVVHFFHSSPHVGWALMIAGLIFMVSSRFDDVVEIGFGSFKTKLERRVKEMENAMDAVRHLAKASARNALNSVQFAGRMGGFSETEKIQFLLDTRSLLSDLGIKEEDFVDIEVEWNRAIEFDYSLWILGFTRKPDDITEDIQPRWKELREGGIAGRATSGEIRKFFEVAEILTPEREERGCPR